MSFDIIKYDAPCGNCKKRIIDWQSKDGKCEGRILEPEEVKAFHSTCPFCGEWNEFQVIIRSFQTKRISEHVNY